MLCRQWCNPAPMSHQRWVQLRFQVQWCQVHLLAATQKRILSYPVDPHLWICWIHNRKVVKKREVLSTPRMDSTLIIAARPCPSYPQQQCHLRHLNHRPLMATERTSITSTFVDAMGWPRWHTLLLSWKLQDFTPMGTQCKSATVVIACPCHNRPQHQCHLRIRL